MCCALCTPHPDAEAGAGCEIRAALFDTFLSLSLSSVHPISSFITSGLDSVVFSPS